MVDDVISGHTGPKMLQKARSELHWGGQIKPEKKCPYGDIYSNNRFFRGNSIFYVKF